MEGVGVYKIMINDHLYIGSSIDLKQRSAKHRSQLKHNCHRNSFLQNCYNKYGINNFKIEPILYCDKSVVRKEEQRLIDELKPDLNATLFVCDETNILTESAKRKISETLKEKYSNGLISNNCEIKIFVYTNDGNRIGEFESVTKASIELFNDSIKGIKGISKVLNGVNHQYKGYRFFKTDKFIKTERKEKVKATYKMIDLTDNSETFISAKEFASKFNVNRNLIYKYYKSGKAYKDRYTIGPVE